MAYNINEAIRSRKYKLVPETKSERIQILVRPNTKAAITAIAADAELSVNELINRILEDFINKED